MKYKINILLIALLFFLTSSSYGQYYNTGVGPASIKWNQLKSNDITTIYPDFYGEKALLISNYLDTITPYITYGMAPIIEPFSVVLRTNNVQSNGLVSWAPKRMELYTTPPANGVPTPWLKQLTAHEYRHVVQMSNLNVGFTKVLSTILGEHIVGLVAAIPSRWFLEGDATVAETELTINGRGVQPEFSIGLRALLNENPKMLDPDKFALGSYHGYTPSVYEYGYHMVRATRRYFGEDFWEKVLRYTGRNPYFILSTSIAYRKYEQTNSTKIFNRTFKELRQFWYNASQEPNSSIFVDSPITSYTTYKSPKFLFNDEIIALKYDFDRTNRVVILDPQNGDERVLRLAPFSQDKIDIQDSIVVWNEYKPSLFWSQKISSVMKISKLSRRKDGSLKISRPKTFQDEEELFLSEIAGNKGYVSVKYDKLNNPSIVLFDKELRETQSFALDGNDVTVNGVAWDNKSQKCYFIVIDNLGVSIKSLDPVSGKMEYVIEPTYVALSRLSAEDGELFFNSTVSGKDEVYIYNIESGTQYKLTSSQYGSFDLAPTRGGNALLTTYSKDGYKIATQHFDRDSLEIVSTNIKTPSMRLVQESQGWGSIKLDTLDCEKAPSYDNVDIKRYRKVPNLFKIHSWLPVGIDLNGLIDDQEITGGIGATLLSQNLLSSMTSIVGYAWDPYKKKSLYIGDFNYEGLPVHMKFKLMYGGDDQDIYLPSDVEFNGDIKDYLSAKVQLSLPFNLTGGSNYRSLTPFSNFTYTNGVIVGDNGDSKYNYVNKLSYGITYQSYNATSSKELAPRLGYILQGAVLCNPFNKDFGKVYNFYSKGYLPGLFANNSLLLSANYQFQKQGSYNFIQDALFPTGNDKVTGTESTLSGEVNYLLPIAYPDFIIPSTLYVKRVWMELYGEYARSWLFDNSTRNDYTYGADILFDINVIRSYIPVITLGVGCYKASQRSTPSLNFTFNLAM